MGRIISVLSGKGGIGKTVSAINIACALNALGKHTLLVDGNISAPTIHIHLGAKDIELSLKDALNGKIHFSDLIHTHASGLQVIPAKTSVSDLKNLDFNKLKEVISDMKNFSDFVIVDTCAGINDESLACLEASDEALIITNLEEATIDATRKIIDTSLELKKDMRGLVVNKSGIWCHELNEREAMNVLEQPIIANIPFDRKVHKSNLLNHPVVYSHPRSKVSKEFFNLASKLL